MKQGTNRPSKNKGGNGSYQTFPTNELSSDGGLTFRPMEYLAEQNRSHRRTVFCLAVVFFVAVFGLAVWMFEFQKITRRGTASSVATERARQVNNAQHAWHHINKHRHRQSSTLNSGCETTVLIIRSCKKVGLDTADEEGDSHCSYVGYERAAFLTTLFGTHRRWPVPSFLYALDPQRKNSINYKHWETLAPLSKKTSVDIELIPHSSMTFAYSTFIPQLQSGALCGKLSVVSSKHSLFSSLANDLGCGPDNGCPMEYPEESWDQVWQIKFVYDAPSLSVVNETSNTIRAKGWTIYGSVGQQGFDPLAFSHSLGDYPRGGSSHGGRWSSEL